MDYKKIMLAIVASLSIVSCTIDDVQDRPAKIAASVDVAPVLLTPVSNTVNLSMSQSISANEGLNISWLDAKFVDAGKPTYQVSIAKAGTNFVTPVLLGSSTGTTQTSLLVFQLNKIIKENFEVELGVITDYEVRVEATLKDKKLYSAPVAVKLATYEPPIEVPSELSGTSVLSYAGQVLNGTSTDFVLTFNWTEASLKGVPASGYQLEYYIKDTSGNIILPMSNGKQLFISTNLYPSENRSIEIEAVTLGRRLRNAALGLNFSNTNQIFFRLRAINKTDEGDVILLSNEFEVTLNP